MFDKSEYGQKLLTDNKQISRNSLPNLVLKNDKIEESYKNLAKKYYDESKQNV